MVIPNLYFPILPRKIFIIKMNYKQTLDYIFANLPMFQRIGAAAYKADLSTTVSLCERLGNPQVLFPSVHIAGTNGKGSVSHLTASVLQESGYKVGLFTSPHMKDYRERIRINGQMIPEEWVVRFVARNREHFEELRPSFFEMTYGLACSWFAEQKVDLVVMETGMGGRLDSTNTCRSILSVITNIAFDHMQFLGSTLPAIAGEKAGIIRKATPVIVGQSQDEVLPVFLQRASDLETSVQLADEHYQVMDWNYNQQDNTVSFSLLKDKSIFLSNLTCELTGAYQKKNLSTAAAICEMLPDLGFSVSSESFKRGIAKVVTNTGIKGRWQRIGNDPLTIADTGHNEDGIRQVLDQLSLMKYDKLWWVLGMVNDKDITAVLKMLPVDANYVFCQASVPRALDAFELEKIASTLGLSGIVIPDVLKATHETRKYAGKGDLVLVGGSTFVAAEVV